MTAQTTHTDNDVPLLSLIVGLWLRHDIVYGDASATTVTDIIDHTTPYLPVPEAAYRHMSRPAITEIVFSQYAAWWLIQWLAQIKTSAGSSEAFPQFPYRVVPPESPIQHRRTSGFYHLYTVRLDKVGRAVVDSTSLSASRPESHLALLQHADRLLLHSHRPCLIPVIDPHLFSSSVLGLDGEEWDNHFADLLVLQALLVVRTLQVEPSGPGAHGSLGGGFVPITPELIRFARMMRHLLVLPVFRAPATVIYRSHSGHCMVLGDTITLSPMPVPTSEADTDPAILQYGWFDFDEPPPAALSGLFELYGAIRSAVSPSEWRRLLVRYPIVLLENISATSAGLMLVPYRVVSPAHRPLRDRRFGWYHIRDAGMAAFRINGDTVTLQCLVPWHDLASVAELVTPVAGVSAPMYAGCPYGRANRPHDSDSAHRTPISLQVRIGTVTPVQATVPDDSDTDAFHRRLGWLADACLAALYESAPLAVHAASVAVPIPSPQLPERVILAVQEDLSTLAALARLFRNRPELVPDNLPLLDIVLSVLNYPPRGKDGSNYELLGWFRFSTHAEWQAWVVSTIRDARRLLKRCDRPGPVAQRVLEATRTLEPDALPIPHQAGTR
jgi:hypothetical protein